MKTSTLCLALPFILAACATTETPSKTPSNGTPTESQSKTGAEIGQAVTTPLSDFNLIRAEIPPVLAAAQKGPYNAPTDASCASLTADIQSLDAVLGPDLDTPPTATNPGLIERGTGAAGNAAVGALRGAAEGIVPFRGWVRKLSGAERYSKDVAAAIAAGTIRRAFLKGLGDAAKCQAPAAPRRSGQSL